MSEVVSQGLKFENEPNGKLSISGATEFGQKICRQRNLMKNMLKVVEHLSDSKAPLQRDFQGGGSRFVIPENWKNGQTITATYTNLQNSTYNGKKISKVVYEVTNLSGGTGIVGFAEKTQQRDLYLYSINRLSRYRINIRFKDADGNPIQFTKTNPAILAMTSFNKKQNLLKGN